MTFHAHTAKDINGDPLPLKHWEPLFTPFGVVDLDDPQKACSGLNGEHDPQYRECPHCKNKAPMHGHLNKVAYWTAEFAKNMLPHSHVDRETLAQWGYVTGLWHDLGKYSSEFQEYLRKASDPHSSEINQKVDHTSAGAMLAVSKGIQGHFIANAIAGHHAGLLDTISDNASLQKRLKKTHGKDLPKIFPHAQILKLALPDLPVFIQKSLKTKPAFAFSFLQRMIFSCLVDADFLAAESFINPALSAQRANDGINLFPKALELLEKRILEFGSPKDMVSIARAKVYRDCSHKASNKPGIFTLTVPTGGGKTLSSLNFALRHAIEHGHRRIIYVIPFTSIIEQNAQVFRDLLEPLGVNIIIEHHSNIAPEKEEKNTTSSRLASENWDSPIVITTSVQFYESLYASRTSRSRKTHNIANSVVILDEAQTLPVNYLHPCLELLKELSANYNSTSVLCTATQPAILKAPDFSIGISDTTEITRDTTALFSALERVQVKYKGLVNDDDLASDLSGTRQALCIVNTKSHAQLLFQALKHAEGENFHLSTNMTPQHRLESLKEIRERLKSNLPVRVISTQLIEAGVDIDFPVVYRSMAGLDSIAQAAGRCNREGKLPALGQVIIFRSEHIKQEQYFAETADAGGEILAAFQDNPLSSESLKAYFDLYYKRQSSRWDQKLILSEFQTGTTADLPSLNQYKTVAEKFQLIENQQISIIIPITQQIISMIESQLKRDNIPINRQLLRNLQRHTVSIREKDFYKHQHQFESIRDGQFYVLICPETHYDKCYGLQLVDTHNNLLLCG